MGSGSGGRVLVKVIFTSKSTIHHYHLIKLHICCNLARLIFKFIKYAMSSRESSVGPKDLKLKEKRKEKDAKERREKEREDKKETRRNYMIKKRKRRQKRRTVAEILLSHPTSCTFLCPAKPSLSFDLTSADPALVEKLSHVLVE
uniref:AHD domain-containing protein n=1 Tax=Heterorhabditis bacteriophora TaxID=37862 RepID=A0A1I7WTY2_HETBA